jgi:hypothetical protein
MHLKVWLHSNRKDCVGLFDFLALAICRMNSARLFKLYQQNNMVRKRQIQMELYAAIISLCPKIVYVTPKWNTLDNKGSIEVVVQFTNNLNQKTMWFLEVLVDGVGTEEHSEQLNLAEKYPSSLHIHSQFAWIDFRQNVATRDFKKDIHVCFSSSFHDATLTNGQNFKIVQLLSC